MPVFPAAYGKSNGSRKNLAGVSGLPSVIFLAEIHPHAFAAAAAAEAAARQGRFWDMHNLLFRHQRALTDGDLRRYAADLGLDAVRFDDDRAGPLVLGRISRDIESGMASGQVLGTPTLFIDGLVHRGGYDAATLLDALAR